MWDKLSAAMALTDTPNVCPLYPLLYNFARHQPCLASRGLRLPVGFLAQPFMGRRPHIYNLILYLSNAITFIDKITDTGLHSSRAHLHPKVGWRCLTLSRVNMLDFRPVRINGEGCCRNPHPSQIHSLANTMALTDTLRVCHLYFLGNNQAISKFSEPIIIEMLGLFYMVNIYMRGPTYEGRTKYFIGWASHVYVHRVE